VHRLGKAAGGKPPREFKSLRLRLGMNNRKFEIRSEVWLYPGMAGWHFLSLPKKESGEIKEKFGKHKRGWGSIPVLVTINKTRWKTSIFPDKKSGSYLLPLRAEVRKKEGIFARDTVSFIVEL
jgi:hypothetical protein